MTDSVQIKVDTAALEKSEKELSILKNKVANRKLVVRFSKAKGTVADNLVDVANHLNDIGTALSLLIQKTESAVTNTRISFTTADNTVAQYWSSSEE